MNILLNFVTIFRNVKNFLKSVERFCPVTGAWVFYLNLFKLIEKRLYIKKYLTNIEVMFEKYKNINSVNRETIV